MFTCKCGHQVDCHNEEDGCIECGCRRYQDVSTDAVYEAAHGRWQKILVCDCEPPHEG